MSFTDTVLSSPLSTSTTPTTSSLSFTSKYSFTDSLGLPEGALEGVLDGTELIDGAPERLFEGA